MTANKTSVEWRCYLFLSVVTGTSRLSAMHIVGKQCQILEWKKDLLNKDQLQGSVTKRSHVNMVIT
jgi:hypothetical protein